MRAPTRIGALLLVALSGLSGGARSAETPVPPGDPTYRALRETKLSADWLPVEDLRLVRDVLTLHFGDGAVYFSERVNQKAWMGVFLGHGSMHLEPATPVELQHLRLLTGKEQLQSFDEDFERAVMVWTDGTMNELSSHGTTKTGAAPDGAIKALERIQHLFREEIHGNLELRILQDLLSEPASGGYFLVWVDGKKHSKLVFSYDPIGVDPDAMGPDESGLFNEHEQQWGWWYLTRSKEALANPSASGPRGRFQALRFKIETNIDKKEKLHSSAEIRLRALREGQRVVNFALAPKLRVEAAEVLPNKTAVPWIQEDEDETSGVALILPEPMKLGQEVEVELRYGGEGVIESAGHDNYFVGQRTDWYPSLGVFSQFADYQLQFCVPKGLTVVSVGQLERRWDEDRQSCSTWKSGVPLQVAGFNYGDFEKRETLDPETGVTLEVYANPGNLGLSIDPTALIDDTMADAMNSVRTYTHFFGPLPYKRVAVTQQPAFGFGQAWPTLVYLPLIAFMTSMERIRIGFQNESISDFVEEVGPHEMAHQWWGHLVGWATYRDQWMSEGFSDFSAALLLEQTEGPKRVREFWRDSRERIVVKGRRSYRPYQAGPVTLGGRLQTHRTEGAYGLVYRKGAYILHMLRMLLRGPRGEDDRFIAMMKDLTRSYGLKSCSTADLQAVVERHMTKELDLDGNGKMDWFFKQWVYGTEIPSYHFESKISRIDSGKVRLEGTLAQKGVSETFRMIVPIYLELDGDRIIRIGQVPCVGTKPVPLKVDLPLKNDPKRCLINANEDILTTD